MKPISDRYVFAKVMGDNPQLCRRLAELLLGREIDRVEMLDSEWEESTVAAHGVRFDVRLKGSREVVAVEMQASKEPSLALRARYYHAWLDRRALPKGDAYDRLPEALVAFVCTYDPVGSGDPVYEVSRRCVSSRGEERPFEDRSRTLLLNAAGDLTLCDPGVAEVLEYVRTGRDGGKSPLVADMEEARRRAYRDEGWVEDMSLLDYDIQREKERVCAEARAEALAEGRAEGRAEGLAEGETRQAALLARMTELGRDAGEFLDAVASGTLGELYRKYGVE